MASLAVARPSGPNNLPGPGPARQGGRPASGALPYHPFPPANIPQSQQIQAAAAAAQQQRKAQHHAKSTPPDPEDLRRRLFIVISEQNARRRLRASQLRLSQFVWTPEKDVAPFDHQGHAPRDGEWTSSEHSSRSSSANQPTHMPSSSTTTNMAIRPRPSSCHNLLQKAADQPHGQQPTSPRPHAFVPTQAAKQFTRTATPDSSLRDPNLTMHALGRTQSVRDRQARGPADPRNRFSLPQGGPSDDDDHHQPAATTAAAPRRRASFFWLGANVAESDERADAAAAAPANFTRSFNDRSREAAVLVDWTQSDEAAAGAAGNSPPGREAERDKPSGPRRIMSPGLLRKADSLWTLRLGRSRRNTGDKLGDLPEKKGGADDEGRRADGGVLPLGGKGARPNVAAPKSPRGGFFSRLRRHS